jgi:amino-acid N-acetyltransferase
VEPVTISPLQEPDRRAVHELLQSQHLPLAGFDDPGVVALVARQGSEIVGSAALEIHGLYGLLRSVVVDDSHRGRHLGLRLTREAIDVARQRRLAALYLLTETAARFFPKVGFVAVTRDEVPEQVRRSVEFASVCPASAQAMWLPLEPT